MSTPEEVAAQDAAKEAQDAKDAEAVLAAAEAEKLAAEKAAAEAKKNLNADELKALLDKSNKDRSSANKEAIDAKKRADAAEAKVKKFEDAQKTDAERLEARAKEAEEEAATAKAETLALRNRGHAQDAGVLKEYRAYAVAEFANADEEDPAKFFKNFKKTHPAMFNGGGEAPAVSTAKGGASAPVATPEVVQAITKIEADLKADPRRRDAFELKRQLIELKKPKKE